MSSFFFFRLGGGEARMIYRWGLEYADCISLRGVRPFNYPSKRDLGSVEYPFIAITPRSILRIIRKRLEYSMSYDCM